MLWPLPTTHTGQRGVSFTNRPAAATVFRNLHAPPWRTANKVLIKTVG